MMTADRRSAYCSNSPAKEEEHTSSSNVFICVPSPVEFAAAREHLRSVDHLMIPECRYLIARWKILRHSGEQVRVANFFTEVTLNITLCKFRCNE